MNNFMGGCRSREKNSSNPFILYHSVCTTPWAGDRVVIKVALVARPAKPRKHQNQHNMGNTAKVTEQPYCGREIR